MDRLFFFFCLCISVFQFLFIGYLYQYLWKKHAPQVVILIKIFFYVNIYKIFFNYILVDILRIFSGGAENIEFGVSSFEIFEVYLIELVSNLIYFLGFTVLLILFCSSKKPVATFSISRQVNILIFLGILSVFNQLLPTVFSKYLWLIKDSLYFLGPICSIIVLVLGIKFEKISWILLGSIPLLLTIVLNLIAGLRGAVVGISICFIILSIIELNRLQFKRVLIIGILPFILLSLIQEKLGEIKYAFVVGVANETIDVGSVSSYINFVQDFFSDNLKIDSDLNPSKPLYKEIEFRYGAPSLFAVGFLRIGSRGDFVFLKPILNSFYSFLPRQLITGKKPVSGSVDGTESTMGMYTCYKEVTGSDSTMTDFLVGGHYYWELGYFGVIFFSLIPAFYNIILILLAKNWGYFGIAILILSFKPYWFLSKLWLSEIIIMIPTIILPSILLFYLLRFFLRIKFSILE